MEEMDSLRDLIKSGSHISESTLVDIFTKVKEILINEPNVIYLKSPMTVCGDVHGQIFDLFKLFEISGAVPTTKYLFLGDYVDRGYCSLETFAYLASLKVKYPDSIYLLRGNHESRQTNRSYGLLNDCLQLYGHSGLWFLANEVFDLLPLMAVIDDQIFCVHGGLSPTFCQLGKAMTDIMRQQEISTEGVMSDLTWSDPDDLVTEFVKNRRGAGYLFGERQVDKFLHTNKLKLIARAHQLSMDGYTWSFNNKLVTVWSAPNYMYRSQNKASVMKTGEGDPEFIVFTEDEDNTFKPDDISLSYFA